MFDHEINHKTIGQRVYVKYIQGLAGVGLSRIWELGIGTIQRSHEGIASRMRRGVLGVHSTSALLVPPKRILDSMDWQPDSRDMRESRIGNRESGIGNQRAKGCGTAINSRAQCSLNLVSRYIGNCVQRGQSSSDERLRNNPVTRGYQPPSAVSRCP
ncbi:hypothetical protein FIBSPDRAFT_297477 [Athelia psychrophila]|uniref:Uncharacterized protein n=1 Tax=Athelia psychrophila TaxID=1759441 RepID=A0A167X841_9AGAM|nr:hypothetical protein FIBSPDRAFT_297477 [Fibularhizoctonia sp. CBS 109695]